MSLKAEVDWAKDGSWTGTYDNVTELVRARSNGITLEYGRDQSTALAPTVAGRGTVTLDNDDRRFSPRNTSSPIYGYVKPSRPVRFTRTMPTSGTTYTLFVGHTDDSPINPDVTTKRVTLSLVDSLADFRGLSISTPLYSSIRTGDAIGYILDACGWSGIARDLDAGATLIPWFWLDNTDALTALDAVLRSEGPPAMLTVGSDGSIVFKDRHHRLTDTASLTSQQTWRADGMIEPVMGIPFSYDEAWRNIVNTGTINVDVRTPGEVEAVWTSDATLSFTSGEVKYITANSSNPFYDAIAPEDGTDFVTLSGSVAASLTRDSGGSTTIVLTSTGASVIQGLALRANPVPVAYSVQVTAEDGASVTDYGSRSFPGDLPWCNAYDVDAVLSTAIALRANPVPIIQARFLINSETKAELLLPRDLSDRVTLVEAETVTNGDFYIESIAHDFNGEFNHSITFGVEAVPTTNPLTQFRFDTTGAGFDDGYFYTGVDSPSTMFRFDAVDASGHGFDDGYFAT